MIDRCDCCGSWEAECGSPEPVKDCRCARCAQAYIHEIERERNALVTIIESSHDMTLNANDTFGYACAEAVSAHTEDLLEILPLIQQYGHHAITAYMAVKHKAEPIPPWLTAEYLAAKVEIERMAAEVTYDKVLENGKRLLLHRLTMNDEPTLYDNAWNWVSSIQEKQDAADARVKQLEETLTRIQDEGDAHSNALATATLTTTQERS